MWNTENQPTFPPFKHRALCLAAGLLLPASLASAQQSASGLQLEEVVVTAQKRGAQSVQDVPISMGVLSGSSLEDAGTVDISEVLNNVGGVNIVRAGAGQNSISVRGVSADATFGGGSTTGYYIDEASFGLVRSSILPDTNAFDLARIEVLRGPQGTLYGASSLNGVVRVITEDADLEAAAFKARLNYSGTDGGGDNYGGDLAASVPIIPGKLAVRAVVSEQETGGWIDTRAETNLIDGIADEDVNSGTSRTYRFKVNAQPTDRLAAELGVWLSRVDTDSPNFAGDDGTTALSSQSAWANQDLDVYSMELNYDFDSFSLLSATTYSEYGTDGEMNILLSGVVPAVITPNTYASEVFTQEFRLTSQHGGDWQWSAGAMYRSSDENITQGAPAFFASRLSLDDESDSWAAFGEVTHTFLGGNADVSLGLRYFEDTVTTTEQSALVPRGYLIEVEDTVDDFSPRLVASYYPNPDLTFYGSVSKGFRSGLINEPSAIAADPSLGDIVEPDILWNYEVGAKGALYNGALTYELALYYLDWSDVQARGVSPLGTAVVRNAGDADGFGADFNLSTRPLDGLTLTLGLGWNGLEVASEQVSAGTVVFREGDRINKSPEYTAGLSADYVFPLGSLTARIAGSYSYVSDMSRKDLIVIAGVAPYVQETGSDAYSVARLSAGVETAHWGASLYVNNLTNEDGAIQPPTSNEGLEAPRLQPRTVGVQLNYFY